MRYISFFLLFNLLLLASCSSSYSPEEVSEAYCKCASLPEDDKPACVKEWSIKYKGVLKTKEEHKTVNYNMIECNGFEGDNDFYLKLMRN